MTDRYIYDMQKGAESNAETPDTRRVIDKVEYLDALPVRSVVLDRCHAWEKYPDDEWYSTELDDGFSSRYLMSILGPVTVIHVPEVTESH